MINFFVNNPECSKLSRRFTKFWIILAIFIWGSLRPSLALPVVNTIGGGLGTAHFGYKDGNTFSNALFRVPTGIALDEYYNFLYVADRDNNAVRVVDLGLGVTSTFVQTNLTARPIGVAVDSDGNVFVLNRGTTNNISTNGYILKFDTYGTLLETNATQLTNAASIALDNVGNLYLTVKSNTLIKIDPSGIKTTIATVTNTGASLQGLVIKQNGLIAVCDAGRHGIYLINPATGTITTNSGFNGPGDGTGLNNHGVLKSAAKFFQPTGIAEAGDGSLIVTDSGNNRLKIVNATIVTNLCGVTSNYWVATYPGWLDGTVKVPDSTTPNVQCRVPVGVVFANDGTIYTTETYYHLIRKITGSGLPQPAPLPPQVATPKIGYVDFPSDSSPVRYTSVFHPVTSFIFNNDAPLIIVGEAGSQTFYTFGNTPSIGLLPDPTSSSASASAGYSDGLFEDQVNTYAVAGIAPFVAIKAIGKKNDGSPDSAIAQAVFQFVTGNPYFSGNNAAQFTINDITKGSTLYYTTDGSDPKTNVNVITVPLVALSTNPLYSAVFNFSSNNFLFKCFARKANYQDSATVSNYFSADNFNPNRMSFGLTNGEPSSAFIARPGQFFYAPITLQLQAGGETMYSLQFNVSVTNGLSNTNKIINSAGIGFSSMLMASVAPEDGLYYPPAAGQWYLPIPPVIGSLNSSPLFTNQNLLGVGWLFRTGIKYLDLSANPKLSFDPSKQDLLSFSIVHDTLFSKNGGLVVAGAYSFQIPSGAKSGDKYYMQIGSPSGTRDGVGAPGADVYIQAPTESTAVTVGAPAYVVGDAAPFHWLNAGDFGEGMLNNADVMQVYQAAIEGVNLPPANSDLFAAMNSSGYLGVWDPVNKYYTNSFNAASFQAMFDGTDQTINTNCFGSGFFSVADVYVTFRRSLDPSLVWFKRYWTNGQFVAVPTSNLAFNSNSPNLLKQNSALIKPKAAIQNDYQKSFITFSAGDAVNSAGQTVQIPIIANVVGNYPLRVLGLNITVQPLDGSPAIGQPIQFTPNSSLGQPTITSSKHAANYNGAWLNSTIAGLSGITTIGTLTITIPTNATSAAAYAIHFDHASASPNGLALIPKQTLTGLITLTPRTNSVYGDGIPDSWRLRWFGTANNYLSASNACPSGDGVSNYKKFVAGVDPNVANNFPSVNPKAKANTGYTSTIHWPTVSGKQYVIERSTDLFAGWSAISTNTGTGGDQEFNDSNTGKVKFYRVRILP